MKVLVVYATKYGSTKGIAEFIADKLRQHGMEAEALEARDVKNPQDYDACIIGSGVYMCHWLKEAVKFVRKNKATLAGRPVWLFSSGPLKLGAEFGSLDDPQLVPGEIAEFEDLVHPKGHRVFFGALDHEKLGFAHRTMARMPGVEEILPDGDFRDWDDIGGWVEGVVRELTSPETG
jgi:menaquinone-dependent protoporphyrinogen oxidase